MLNEANALSRLVTCHQPILTIPSAQHALGNDDEQTRFYLDANTGALVYATDSAGRWRRWLFSGLHRLDFAEWMRERPFRDVLMWLTLLGGL